MKSRVKIQHFCFKVNYYLIALNGNVHLGPPPWIQHCLKSFLIEICNKNIILERILTCEKESCERHNLVKLDVGIEGYELLQRHLPDACDEVAAHGQQENRVAEGEGGRRTASKRDAHSHHVTKVHVFREVSVDWKIKTTCQNFLKMLNEVLEISIIKIVCT